MLFNFNEHDLDTNVPVEDADAETIEDTIISQDPDTEEGIENIASEVEAITMQAALEAVTFFEGGEQSVKNFRESAEVKTLLEARRMSKRTFVRLNKDDDLLRRTHLASIIVAKQKNDPLFRKYAFHTAKRKQFRQLIYKKYYNKALMIAKRSQKQHIKDMRKMPALPVIKF